MQDQRLTISNSVYAGPEEVRLKGESPRTDWNLSQG